ncbi:zinc finger protein 532-like [Branchiostoma floridae x Branchiostoma belcheri]
MATDVKTPDFDDLLAAFDIPDMTEGKDAFEHGTDHETPAEGSRGDNLTQDGGTLTTPVKPMPQLQRTRDIVPEIRPDASPDRMPSPLEPIFNLPTNQSEVTADPLSSQSEQPYHLPTVKPEPGSDTPSVTIKREPVADSTPDQSQHLSVIKHDQSEPFLDEISTQSETGLDNLKSEQKYRSPSPQEVASTRKSPSIPKKKVDIKPASDKEKTSTKSIETASSRIEKLVTSLRDEEKVNPLPPKCDEVKSSATKVAPPELQSVPNSQPAAKPGGDAKVKNLLNSEQKTTVKAPPTVKQIAPKPTNKPEPSAAKAKEQVAIDDAKTSTNKPYNTRPRKQNFKFTFEDDCEFEDEFTDESERDKQPAKSVPAGNQNSIAAMQLRELMRQADKDKKESEAASAGQGSIPKVRITTLRTSQGTIMTAQSVPKQSIIPNSTSSSSVVPIVRTLTTAAMGQLHVAQPQATATKTSIVSSPATVQSPGQLNNRVVTQVLTSGNASVRTTPSGTTVHTVTNLGIASILNKPNPVSTYSPNLNVPAKYNLSVPKNGHKCLECGDTFLLYTSLLHHMQRRSIMITINCNICMKSMLFQNKCALLSHSRLHMNRGKKMNLASAIVTPLLKELMNLGQPNPSAPPDVHTSIGQTIVSSVSTSTVQRATVQSVQTTVTSSVSSSQTRPSPSLQQLVMGSQPGAMSCTECRIIVNSLSSLEIHFQRNTTDLKSPSLCPQCGVFFPNKCMLGAHQRIHKNLAPYTCPECGKWEKGGRSVFLKHLRTACHHYARSKGYKCTHCAAVYDHVNLLKAHVQSAHAEQFYKCPICPMAFKAIPNIRVHILNTHGNQVAGYRSIYKCPLCDTVFTQTTLLSTHLDTHINDKSNHIVSHFRCLECHKSFDPRETFLQHMQTGHVVDMSDNIVLCDLCKASFPSLIDMESHKKMAHSSYVNLTAHTCTQCHQKFGSAQHLLDHDCRQRDNKSVNSDSSNKKHQCSLCSYVAKTEGNLVKHMKFHERQGVFTCLECGRQLASQELLAEHLQTHTKGTVHNCSECKASFAKASLLYSHMTKEHGKPKKYPCSMCNRMFESVHSMKRHVRINHQGIKRVYRCWYCKEKPMSYSKRIMLEKHIVSIHGIASEDIDFTQMPDPKQPVSPDQDVSMGNEKRRKNGGQQGGAAKRPKRAKMGFQCAKCEFTTEVKEEFLQHFPQHKQNHTSIQCMECSTSFRSEDALRNHLFVQHEYRDQDELTSVLSEMVAYAEKANSQQDSSVNGVANPHNECSVCFKRFDSDSALKTHMRTHGMAFIRSKRSSSND